MNFDTEVNFDIKVKIKREKKYFCAQPVSFFGELIFALNTQKISTRKN